MGFDNNPRSTITFVPNLPGSFPSSTTGNTLCVVLSITSTTRITFLTLFRVTTCDLVLLDLQWKCSSSMAQVEHLRMVRPFKSKIISYILGLRCLTFFDMRRTNTVIGNSRRLFVSSRNITWTETNILIEPAISEAAPSTA